MQVALSERENIVQPIDNYCSNIYNIYMIFEWDEENEQYWKKKEANVKKNYDFSNAVKNPYAKKLKKTICINISESVLTYFKELSEKTDIPYQTLINMFLAQAKAEKMVPKFVSDSKRPRKKQVA